MKKLFFILIFMMISISAAFAQDVELKSEEDLIIIAENNGFTGQLEQDLKDLKNEPGMAAVIKQVGNNNKAVITQNGANLFAFILQDGNYLDATLILKGANNNAIIKQDGSYLTTDVKLIGHNNDLKLLQAGDNLSNKVRLLNITGMDVVLLQTEGRFLYSQNSNGNGIPLQIETTQSVPRIIVRNN